MSLSTKAYKDLLEIIELTCSIPERIAMSGAVCEKIEKSVGISSDVFLPGSLKNKNFGGLFI